MLPGFMWANFGRPGTTLQTRKSGSIQEMSGDNEYNLYRHLL